MPYASENSIERTIGLFGNRDRLGLLMRQNVPTPWKTNFATALLLCGQRLGCRGVLDEIGDESDPSVQRPRQAISRTRSQRTHWQKFCDWVRGIERPVHLGIPPGEF